MNISPITILPMPVPAKPLFNGNPGVVAPYQGGAVRIHPDKN